MINLEENEIQFLHYIIGKKWVYPHDCWEYDKNKNIVPVGINLTFDNPDDFFTLWNVCKEKEWWIEFFEKETFLSLKENTISEIDHHERSPWEAKMGLNDLINFIEFPRIIVKFLKHFHSEIWKEFWEKECVYKNDWYVCKECSVFTILGMNWKNCLSKDCAIKNYELQRLKLRSFDAR